MIEGRDISKRYGDQILFSRASFRLPPGARVGVVGPNGAGKTTLFDLMTGEADCDAGTISRRRDLRLGYLPQQVPSAPPGTTLLAFASSLMPSRGAIASEMAGLDRALPAASGDDARRILVRLGELQERLERMGEYAADALAAQTLRGIGFAPGDPGRPFADFSGGWKMRAALARALLSEPEVLLLDEPGNYLDLPAIEYLRRALAAFRGTLAMISHDRYLLETLTRETWCVAFGKIERYPGPYSFYERERAARAEQAAAARKNELRRRKEIERFVDRFRAKATLAKRVQSKIRLLEKMEETDEVLVAHGRTDFRIPPPPSSGREILRAEGLGFAYEPGRWIFRGADLSLQRGDKTCLVGPNGAGKTTLLRVLAGRLAPGEGNLRYGLRVSPGYQSQESAETLDPTATCLGILRAVAPDAAEKDLRSALGGFGFSGAAAEKTVSVLSGGERIRLAFARLLVRPPNLLLLDEPTTHLDLESRAALERAIVAYEGTAIVVSHDIAFVRAVAREILELRGDGTLRRYTGGYDEYRAAADREGGVPPEKGADAPEPADDAKAKARERAAERKALASDLRKAEKALEKAEAELAALEGEETRLAAMLADPAAGEAERADAGKALKALAAEKAEAEARWEEAGTARDTLAARLQTLAS
jgi:ATP-binding cassette subfamily F protein 3